MQQHCCSSRNTSCLAAGDRWDVSGDCWVSFPSCQAVQLLMKVLPLCLQRELTSSGDAPNEILLWKEEGLCCAPGMLCCSACNLLSACPASADLKSWGDPPTFCGSDRTGRVSAQDKSCCHVSKVI